MTIRKDDFRDSVGYLSKNGKKIDFICPWCGWVHTKDAYRLVHEVRCQRGSTRWVRITELRPAPVPVDEIIKAKNQYLKEALQGGVSNGI